MLVDCCLFYNEHELLELRLKLLQDYVDAFIIVEGTKTFQGDDKPLTALEFVKTIEGIDQTKIGVVQAKLPSREEFASPWVREYLSRDAVEAGLQSFPEGTYFWLFDVDEIPDPTKIEELKAKYHRTSKDIVKFSLSFHYGRIDLQVCDGQGQPMGWTSGIFSQIKHLKNYQNIEVKQPHDAMQWGKYKPAAVGAMWANTENFEVFGDQDAGWHLSWMGDEEARISKVEAFCHGELNTEQSRQLLKNFNARIGGGDMFGRPGHVLQNFPEERIPDLVRNTEKFRNYLMPSQQERKQTALPIFG